MHASRLLVCRREKERGNPRAAALGKHLADPLHLAVLGCMNSALPSQIESLFERHPTLCGFCVLGLDDVPDSCPRGAADESGLYVGDVGVSPEPSPEQLGEIFQEIAAAVADLLAEVPDAGEKLRGRTFARALH